MKSGRRRPDRDAEDVGDAVETRVEVVVPGYPHEMVDGEPAQATFDLAAVDDRAQVPIRYVKLATAAAAVVLVAVVGINLLPSFGRVEGSPTSPSPWPAATTARSTSPSPAATAWQPPFSEIRPGSHSIPWEHGSVHLTMPAGWGSGDAGAAIYKFGLLGFLDPDLPGLAVQPVTRVETGICSGPLGQLVGPTVADLTTALANQVGTQKAGPTDVMLGGFPARKLVLTLSDDFDAACGGDGRFLWENVTGSHFGLLQGGMATVYIVDVSGDRLVIASTHRGASAEDIAELDAIIASIEIEPLFEEWLGFGRHSLTVDGVSFSFSVPELAPDQGWNRYGTLYISKDTEGSQGAEAAIYWTGFPDGEYLDPCRGVLSPLVGPSAADLATAVSTAPGTELVAGPSDVTVGGRPAKHMELIVRNDVGCDPGFFHTWEPAPGGPGWWGTSAGDTIRVWIIDVDGTLLFIAGETTTDARPDLKQELQQIVDSIRFE